MVQCIIAALTDPLLPELSNRLWSKVGMCSAFTGYPREVQNAFSKNACSTSGVIGRQGLNPACVRYRP